MPQKLLMHGHNIMYSNGQHLTQTSKSNCTNLANAYLFSDYLTSLEKYNRQMRLEKDITLHAVAIACYAFFSVFFQNDVSGSLFGSAQLAAAAGDQQQTVLHSLGS